MIRSPLASAVQALVVPLIVLCAACGGDGEDSAGAVPTQAQTRSSAGTNVALPYRLRPTLRCLERRGARIDRKLPVDARLRALRDLAQRTSVLARIDKQVVGLAVVRTTSDAALLISLLRAPGEHRLIQRRNAVLLFSPAARAASDAAEACLRHG